MYFSRIDKLITKDFEKNLPRIRIITDKYSASRVFRKMIKPGKINIYLI